MAAALAVAAELIAPFPAFAQDKTPPTTGAATAPQAAMPTWKFVAGAAPDAQGWTAEHGTLTVVGGEARLRPDANRRFFLVSPPALPETTRHAEEFVLQIAGTGLQRVRVQARRDERGGWFTIADAAGIALRETPDGYVIKRNPGARDAPIERLRIELHFRTTNPRVMTGIAIR